MPLYQRLVKRVSPVPLGLAVLFFLLPMVQVSCAAPTGYGSGGGGVTSSYSGLSLATGGDSRADPNDHALDPAASRSEDRVGSQPLIAAGLVLAVVALVVSLAGWAPRRRLLTVGVTAVLAAATTVAGALIFSVVLRDAVIAKVSRVHPAAVNADTAGKVVAISSSLWVIGGLLLVTGAANLWALRDRALPPAPTLSDKSGR